jgi:hypothetical protein
MGTGRKPTDRQELVFFSGSLAANQTLSNKLGASTSPVFPIHGQKRIGGNFSSSVAPAAGFPQISFSADGANWSLVYSPGAGLTQDTTQAGFQYPFDFPVSMSYVRIETKAGGALDPTVAVEVYTYTDGSGPFVSGGGSGGGGGGGGQTTLTPLGNGQLATIDNVTAVGLAAIYGAPIPAGATLAVIQIGTGTVADLSVPCVGDDAGGTPTPTTGGLTFLPGVQYQYNVNPLSNLKIIGTSLGPTTARVSFYK